MSNENPEASRAKRMREALEADSLDYIEGCRLRAENEENTLYVWRALQQWFAINTKRQHAGIEPMPMPSWCMSWLAIFATRLTDLSHGLDFREAPVPYGDLQWKNVDEHRAAVERARNRPEDFKPTARDVSEAFGLTRQGKNAFADARRLTECALDDLAYRVFQQAGGGVGVTNEAAIEMIAGDHAEAKTPTRLASGDRGIRKRIAKARKATQPRK